MMNNTRLAVVLLFGLLLAGQEAAAAAAEASYGKAASKAECEIPGTCDRKLGDISDRPGAQANKYNRGCNKITGCRG
ncbi:hypothetical protein BDA96_03G065200 [Sorghum bicolor]|uniref:Uncharacterized protein n=2 Tax=Sorghum bicolor TaxID=4558 RepID=A0A921UMG9_SORBI|nr:hypothetical protein BDA96_03G065200 [Sorghum bicolor]OQU86269.1 hypothetical protein SORBI_3003G061700 [Sorghum bicolor]